MLQSHIGHSGIGSGSSADYKSIFSDEIIDNEYILQASDEYLLFESDENVKVIIPSDIAMPIGKKIPGWNNGPGEVTFASSAVVLNSGKQAVPVGGSFFLEKTGVDKWQLVISSKMMSDPYAIQKVFAKKFLTDENGTTSLDLIGDQTRPVQQGGCLVFNGTDGYVDVGNIGSTAETISLWFYNPVIITKSYTLSGLINIEGGVGAIMFGNVTSIFPDDIISYFTDSGARCSWTGDDEIAIGWHHLLLVWDSGNTKYRMFLDNEEKTVSVVGTPHIFSANNVQIGRRQPALSLADIYFAGSVSDVRLLNTALDESQITELYNHNPKVATENLVAHYKTEETSGTKALDASGNGNDGDLMGGVTFGTQNLYSYANVEGCNADLWFDGVDDKVAVKDNASIQNIFDGGGEVEVYINPKSDGENNNGRILDKGESGWGCYVYSEIGGFVKLAFRQKFTGGFSSWATDTAIIPLNQVSKINIIYNSNSPDNDPIIKLNGNTLSLTKTPSTGTRESDIGNDLRIGNLQSSTARTFDGEIFGIKIWNDTSQASLVAHYKLNEMSGLPKDYSGNNNHATAMTASWHIIPQDDNNIGFDIYGDVLEYKGRVKYNPKIVGNNCVKFNGTDGCVDTGFNYRQANGSIFIRFKFLGESTSSQYLLGQQNAPFMLGVRRVGGDDRLTFWVRNNTEYPILYSEKELNDEKWHWAGLTWGSEGAKLYVDGRLNDSDPSTGYDDSSTVNMLLGATNLDGTPSFFYNGELSDIRFFTSQKGLTEFQKMADGDIKIDSYAYYPGSGEGDMLWDVVGGNNGNFIDGVTRATQDKFAYSIQAGFDSAAYFNGFNSGITVSDPLDYIGSGSWTVIVNVFLIGSGRHVLLGGYNISGCGQINIEVTENGVLRVYWNGGSPNAVSGAGAVPYNEWVTLTVQRTADKFLGYVNELPFTLGSGLGSGIDITITGNHKIGRDSRTGSTTLHGYMSRFEIYDTVLSESDVIKRVNSRGIDTAPRLNYEEFTDEAIDTAGSNNGVMSASWAGIPAKLDGASLIPFTRRFLHLPYLHSKVNLPVIEDLQIVGDITVHMEFFIGELRDGTLITCAAVGESLETNLLCQIDIQPDGTLLWFHEYDDGDNETISSSVILTADTYYEISATRDSINKTITFTINGEAEQVAYENNAEKAVGGNLQTVALGNYHAWNRYVDVKLFEAKIAVHGEDKLHFVFNKQTGTEIIDRIHNYEGIITDGIWGAEAVYAGRPSNPGGYPHNNAESEMQQPLAPELTQADDGDFFNPDGTAKNLSFNDLKSIDQPNISMETTNSIIKKLKVRKKL